jgi:RecB family exonuclease
VKRIKLAAWAAADYDRCPLQYRLRHTSALPPVDDGETSPAQVVGQSLHAALHALHRPDRPFNGDVTAEPLLRRHWVRQGFQDAQQEAAWFDRARFALERYLASAAPLTGRVLAAEAFLSARWKHNGLECEVTARADRIERQPDGTLVVTDYKCSLNGRVLSEEALAQDLVSYLYALLARLRYPDHTRVIVTHLNLFTLQATAIEHTPDQRRANRARLLAVIDGIASAQYAPRPGQHCAWCPVRAACPAVSVAADSAALDE